jgi:hypothetical protein
LLFVSLTRIRIDLDSLPQRFQSFFFFFSFSRHVQKKKKINNFIFFFLLVRAINQRIMADSNHERKAHEKRLAEDPLPFEPSSPTPLPPGEQALVLWASLLALFLLYLPHTIVHQTTGTHLFNIALRRPEFVALLASFSGTIGPSTHTLTTSLSTPVTTEAIFLSALNTVGALPATIEAAPFTRAFRSEVLIPVSPLARLRALALLIHKTDLLCRCNAALTLNVVRVLTALWNSTIPDVLEDFMGVLLDPSLDQMTALQSSLHMDTLATLHQYFLNPVRTAWARRTAANFTAANVIAEASTIFTLISSQITLAATVVPPTPPPAPAAPALAAISSTPAADAAVAAISSSSTTSKRRKPKAAPPQNPPPAPANQPNQPSGGCWNCRAPGCHSSRCPFPKATVNTPPSKPYPVCSLSVVDAPTTHTPWSQPLQLTTRALLGSLTTVALFDTGASVSAIDTSFAATASLPIAPYTGPRLRAAHGHEVVPRGQITIPTLTLPGWTGPLGPIAVIDNLVASLLIGLPDMKRFGTVHIDLRTATPRLFLGTTPPAALIAALGVVEPSLLSASTAAADAEHRLHADDAAAADGAIPLPAGLSPSNARTAPPEIDFDSAAEIAHRTDFHARHADAHHQLHLADDVPTLYAHHTHRHHARTLIHLCH